VSGDEYGWALAIAEELGLRRLDPRSRAHGEALAAVA